MPVLVSSNFDDDSIKNEPSFHVNDKSYNTTKNVKTAQNVKTLQKQHNINASGSKLYMNLKKNNFYICKK